MSPVQTIKLAKFEKKALQKIKLKEIVDYIQLVHILKLPIKRTNLILKTLRAEKLIEVKTKAYYNEIKPTDKGLSVRISIRKPVAPIQTTPDLSPLKGYPINLKLETIQISLNNTISLAEKHRIMSKCREDLELITSSTEYTSSRKEHWIIVGSNSNSESTLSQIDFTALMLWLENYAHFISKIFIEFLYLSRTERNQEVLGSKTAKSDMHSSAPLNLLKKMTSVYPNNLKFKEIEIKLSYDVSDERVSRLQYHISQHIGVNPHSRRGNDERSIYVRNDRGAEVTESKFKEFMEFLRIRYPDQIFEIFLSYVTDDETEPRNYRTLYRSQSISPADELENYLTVPNYQIKTLFNDKTPVRISIEYDYSIETEDLRTILINLDFQYLEPTMYVPEDEDDEDADDYEDIDDPTKIISIRSVPLNAEPMVEPLNHERILRLIQMLNSYNSSVSSAYRDKIRDIHCVISKEGSRTKRFRAASYAIGNETTEPLNKLKHWLSNTNWSKIRRKKTIKKRKKKR